MEHFQSKTGIRLVLSKKIFYLLTLFCAFISLKVIAQDDAKSYVSSDKIFILKYPSDWKENKTEPAEFCVNAPGAGLLSICMVKADIKKMAEGYENADIHEISGAELKMLKAQPEQSMNLQILESSFKVINGDEWWIIYGKITKGNKTYFTNSYKAIHNHKDYTFTYFSNEKNYEKNKEAALKILTTVEFLTKNGSSASTTKTTTDKSSDDRINSSSDDRVSNSVPVISNKPLWSLKSATGWMKNKEGQWVSGKNKIQKHSMSLVDSSNWNKGINATGLDNFINIEVREIKVGNKSFIILIKAMKDGQKEYETSPESWQPLNRAKYYVLQKNETKATPEENGAFSYKMKLYFAGFVPYDKDYLHNIALRISEENNKEPGLKETGSTARILFYYKELNDGKKCRFALVSNSGVETFYDPTPQYQEFHPTVVFPDYYYECNKPDVKGMLDLIEKK